MDILDIYSIPEDTRVIVAVSDLRHLYDRAYFNGYDAEEYGTDSTIKGEIV